MSEYRNKVPTAACPCCGNKRPIDWFVKDGGICWKCRATSWQRPGEDEPESETSKPMEQMFANKGNRRPKAVVMDGEAVFPSLRDAAEFVGAKGTATIAKACRGIYKTAYGHTWAYKEGE